MEKRMVCKIVKKELFSYNVNILSKLFGVMYCVWKTKSERLRQEDGK